MPFLGQDRHQRPTIAKSPHHRVRPVGRHGRGMFGISLNNIVRSPNPEPHVVGPPHHPHSWVTPLQRSLSGDESFREQCPWASSYWKAWGVSRTIVTVLPTFSDVARSQGEAILFSGQASGLRASVSASFDNIQHGITSYAPLFLVLFDRVAILR